MAAAVPRGMDGDGCLGGRGEVHDSYLDLLQRMRVSKEDLVEDKQGLDEVISTSNRLFKRIRTSSELKLDAKITALSTRLACTRMEKDIEAGEMTAGRFVLLFGKACFEDFHGYAMKCDLGMRFQRGLSLGVSGECGGRKRQAPRTKQAVPEADVVQPTARAPEAEDEPEALVQIKRLVEERGRIEYFRLVVDPKSFSRTIENIFHLSLAVRCGAASLVYEDKVLYAASPDSTGSGDPGHLAVEMTYDEYLRIVESSGACEGPMKS